MRLPITPVITGETDSSVKGEEAGGESSSWCPLQHHHEEQGADESEESTMARLEDEEEEWSHQSHQQQQQPAVVNTCLHQVPSTSGLPTDVNVNTAEQVPCFSSHHHQDEIGSTSSSKSRNSLASFTIHTISDDDDDQTSSSRPFDEPPFLASNTAAIANDNENAINDLSSSLSLFANVKGVWIEQGADLEGDSSNIMSVDATSIGSSTSNCTNSTRCTISPGAQGGQASVINHDDDCSDFYSAHLSSVRSSFAGDIEIDDSWSSSNSSSNSRTSPATADHNNDSMEMLERGLWEIKLERCLLEIHGPAAAAYDHHDKMLTSMTTHKKLRSDNLLLLEQQEEDKLVLMNDHDDPRYSLCHMALEYEYNDGHDAHAEFDLLYNALEDGSNNVYRDQAKKRSLYPSPLLDKWRMEAAMTSTTNTTWTDFDNHQTNGNKKNSDNDGRFDDDDDDDTATSDDDPPPHAMLPQHYLAELSPPLPQCKNEGSDSSLSTAKAGSSCCTPDCIAISDESHSELSDHLHFLHHDDDELHHHRQPTKWLYYQDRDDDDDDNALPSDEENSVVRSCYETGFPSSPPTLGQTNSSVYTQKEADVSLPSNEPQDKEQATNVEEPNLLAPSLLLKSLSLPRSSSFLSTKSMSLTTTHASTASSAEVSSTISCSVVVGSFSSMLLDSHNDDYDDDNDSEWTDSVASSSMATSMDLSAAAYKSCCDGDSTTRDSIDMMVTDDNTSFVSARDDMGDFTDDDADDDDVEKQMTPDQQSNKSQQDVREGRQKPPAKGLHKSQRQRRQKSVKLTSPEEATRTCCMCQRQHLSYQLAGLSVVALLMVAILLWGHLQRENNYEHSNDNNIDSSNSTSYLSGAAAGIFSTNRPTLAPVPSPLDTIMEASAATPSPSHQVFVKLWSNDLFS